MRQVPLPKETHYLLIGNGKVSRHFQHYFSKKNIPFYVERFPRLLNSLDKETWKKCNRILLLVSDDAIESVYNAVEVLRNEKWRNELPSEVVYIHFSGVKTLPGIFGTHPLMTFGEQLYEESFYSTIPFVFSSSEIKSLSELMPSLKNPSFSIPAEKRPLYHAACVGAGNFSMLLWREVFEVFEKDLSLPKEVLRPFLEQSLKNSFLDPTKNLTGPFIRGDLNTIEMHREALKGRSFLSLYEKFSEWMRERFPKRDGLK